MFYIKLLNFLTKIFELMFKKYIKDNYLMFKIFFVQ